MTDHKNNPHKSDSPEWQLFEDAKILELQSLSHFADAERSSINAIACKEKAERFWDALRRLGAQ